MTSHSEGVQLGTRRNDRRTRSAQTVAAGKNGWNRAAAVAWTFAALAIVLLIGAVALLFSQAVTIGDGQGIFVPALEVLAFALTGALIITGRPRHPIGWIYVASALLTAIGMFAIVYSTVADQRGLQYRTAALAVFAISWFAGNLLPITIGLLLFPNGRLPSARWRAVVAITAVGYLAIVGNNALAGRPEYETLRAISGLGMLAIPIAILASVGSLVWRWQHTIGVERQQLKWVGAAALFLGLDVVVVLLFASIGVFPESGSVTVAVLTLGIALVPVAVAVAILRYRLYDIDVLINRTLVYGATSAGIVAAFFGGIVVLQALLRPLTSGSEIAVAGSTLVSFALFQPLRRRVQGAVDHRFYRSRYDAERTLDLFSVRLRDEVDLESVRGELLDAVGRTVQPAHASVWLRR
jgi:MFS family permease